VHGLDKSARELKVIGCGDAWKIGSQEPRRSWLDASTPHVARELTKTSVRRRGALDRTAVQGDAFRLSFHRSTFHRRAENFTDHVLYTGWMDGRLVALLAVGYKDVVLQGSPMRAGFAFDLRVHPDFRRRGIGRRIVHDAIDHGRSIADFGYLWLIDDNRAAQALAGLFDAEVEGPFDLYSDPRRRGNLEPHVSSWIVRDGRDVAGCSVWDNRDILGEVVEALPLRLRMARALFESPLLRGSELPHIPQTGEQVRSWYLFDAFATRPDLAVDLIRHLAHLAREQDIDFCHLPHIESQTWVSAVRAEVPRMFAPVLRYRMLASWDRREPFPRLERIYVDIRDL
jgi:GNAT superfamily N-acetyltransferase